ncbi:Gfo/Idh/MocA family protein [Leadbettera azotonutricia]|uniref:Oxidoreductase n=1 Tax=Leadbettera azotonutricia (strain ATCC BAA-888 / DSM 13862 / ZAS-9) TaxID=545695 RepID=F5YAE6_LEAAZ|nr:Gfo/Idh/MocA family oxidoreductase [Leadbettera azotonutricia]AEF83266.1 oxidoreductase [Leadbettera azotonutricia ZAS-9]
MEKIPVAIIGLGRIASLLEEDEKREKPCTHAGAVSNNPDCILAAGCDIDAERRDLFAGRWKVPVYEDAETMMAKHRPGIMAIATHPDSHYYYCKLAVAHNIPVVICEKPLADTLNKAKAIAALARNGNTRIIVNHERRYSADYIKAKAILDSGSLGPLLSARAVLYMGKTRRLADVFWHDGTHLADAVMFLTDSILAHKKHWGAKLNAREGTAWLAGILKKPTRARDAIPFVMEAGAGRDHLVFELEFSCTQGRLRIGNGVFEVWKSDESPYAEKFRSLKLSGEAFEGPTGFFANMVADAAACFHDPARQPRSGAINGLKAIEYLHSVIPWSNSRS